MNFGLSVLLQIGLLVFRGDDSDEWPVISRTVNHLLVHMLQKWIVKSVPRGHQINLDGRWLNRAKNGELSYQGGTKFVCNPLVISSMEACMECVCYLACYMHQQNVFFNTSRGSFEGNKDVLLQYFMELVLCGIKLGLRESPAEKDENIIVLAAKLLHKLLLSIYCIGSISESMQTSIYNLIMGVTTGFPESVCLLVAMGGPKIDSLPFDKIDDVDDADDADADGDDADDADADDDDADDDADADDDDADDNDDDGNSDDADADADADVGADDGGHDGVGVVDDPDSEKIIPTIKCMSDLFSTIAQFNNPRPKNLYAILFQILLTQYKTPEQHTAAFTNVAVFLFASQPSGGSALALVTSIKKTMTVQMEPQIYADFCLRTCLSVAHYLVRNMVHSDEFLLDPSALQQQINDFLKTFFSTYKSVRELIEKGMKKLLSPRLVELSEESLLSKMVLNQLFPAEMKLPVVCLEALQAKVCSDEGVKKEHASVVTECSRLQAQINLLFELLNSNKRFHGKFNCPPEKTICLCLIELPKERQRAVDARQILWNKNTIGEQIRIRKYSMSCDDVFCEDDFLNDRYPEYVMARDRCKQIEAIIEEFQICSKSVIPVIHRVQDLYSDQTAKLGAMQAQLDELHARRTVLSEQIKQRTEHARQRIFEVLGIHPDQD